MKKTLVAVALSVLLMAASAQASVLYYDAIGIALNDGSAISAATSLTGYVPQVNWINGTSGSDSVTLDKQLTKNGVGTSLTATMSYWHDASGGNDPVAWINTGLTGFANGLATGTADPAIEITGIPFATYDAAVMTATMTQDGWNDKMDAGSQHWTLVTGLTGATWSSLQPRYGAGGDTVLAVQILSTVGPRDEHMPGEETCATVSADLSLAASPPDQRS